MPTFAQNLLLCFMANLIRIRKGLDIKLKGKAIETLSQVNHSDLCALTVSDFHGLTPKVVVRPGDKVKAGSVLLCDKNCQEVKFVSPVSGTVVAVNRGDKRKVLDVLVKADSTLEYESFPQIDALKASGEEVKSHLLNAGMWPFIKQRPYDLIANPQDTPKAVFISSFDTAPLAADFEYVLKGQEADFQTGLNALARIAPVQLGVHENAQSSALKNASNVTINTFAGKHPTGNVGVQIHHVSPINKGEIVWVINPQDVIIIGRLFHKGVTDFTRIVALTGSEVVKTGYVKMQAGTPILSLFKSNVTKGKTLRYISGNVLTGTQITPDSYLNFYANQLTVIPEGTENHEMIGWIMPRLDQFSANHSYFSWLLPKKEYVLDARIKGGNRALIMSNELDKVFPFDIYPEVLLKAIITNNIDQMELLGIYEVAPEDFALCEFVDTSKTEIQKIVREGLDMLFKEMN